MNWLRVILFSILDTEEEDSNDFIIARYILDNYRRLAGISLTEISKQCHVSKASISRFCKKIGLSDYIDLQMLIRTSDKALIHKEEISLEDQKNNYLKRLNHSIDQFTQIVDNPMVESLIQDIKSYSSIFIFGHLQSSHIAYTLRNNLAMVSKFCFCSQSVSTQKQKLEEMTKDDLLIVFTSSGNFFKRLDVNMNRLKAQGCKIYMVTFEDNFGPEGDHLNKIYLGKDYEALTANVLMNIFINYISYRVS